MNFVNTPEHIHLLINHLPLVGFGAAALALLYALIIKDKKSLMLGFLFTIIFGGATYFVIETGEAAHERFESPPLETLIGGEGIEWMEIHHERAETVSKLMYATAALGLIGLILGFTDTRRLFIVGFLALLMSLASVGAGMWVADAGGKIHHPEFRSTPVMQPETDKDNNGHNHGHDHGHD